MTGWLMKLGVVKTQREARLVLAALVTVLLLVGAFVGRGVLRPEPPPMVDAANMD